MTTGLRIHVSAEGLTGQDLDRVVGHLERGGLLAYPTETVYGFGGLVDERPVEALRRLKGQSKRAGFILLIESPESMPDLTWTDASLRLAQAFWPGPLTLVLRDQSGTFPPGVAGPDGTVAVRVSPHGVPRDIVQAVGRPITSSSANRPGDAPAMTADRAIHAAESQLTNPGLLVLDAGTLPAASPSTIVDATGEVIRLLRVGAIDVDSIASILPEIHERHA